MNANKATETAPSFYSHTFGFYCARRWISLRALFAARRASPTTNREIKSWLAKRARTGRRRIGIASYSIPNFNRFRQRVAVRVCAEIAHAPMLQLGAGVKCSQFP